MSKSRGLRSSSNPPKRKKVNVVFSHFPYHPSSVFFPTLPAIRVRDEEEDIPHEPIPIEKKKHLSKLFFYTVPGSIEFNAVTRTLKRAGFLPTRYPHKANIIWGKLFTDEFTEMAREMNEYQRMNHFPGSIPQIGRKDTLFRNVQKMQILYGKRDFGFVPNSYLYPEQKDLLKRVMSTNEVQFPSRLTVSSHGPTTSSFELISSPYGDRHHQQHSSSSYHSRMLTGNARSRVRRIPKPIKKLKNRRSKTTSARIGFEISRRNVRPISPLKQFRKRKRKKKKTVKKKKKVKKKAKKKYFIVKPKSMSRGRGIVITRKYKDVCKRRQAIVSDYISRPLLIDRRKVDLRVYVLVTSFHPLKVYRYQEGLVRFASAPYTLKKSSRYVHLTNYSVNKKNKNWGSSSNGSKNETSPTSSLAEGRIISPNSTREVINFGPCQTGQVEGGPGEDRPIPLSEGDGHPSQYDDDENDSEGGSISPVSLPSSVSSSTSSSSMSSSKASSPSAPPPPIKWNFEQFQDHMINDKGLSHFDYSQMWGRIDDVIIKTLISVESKINDRVLRIPSSSTTSSTASSSTTSSPRSSIGSNSPSSEFEEIDYDPNGMFYNQTPKTNLLQKDRYFEVFGFDILLDEELNPWLIEVNCCPSLASGTPLDKKVKYNLISDAMNIIQVIPYDRKKLEMKRKKDREYRLIGYNQKTNLNSIMYPNNNKRRRKNLKRSHYLTPKNTNYHRPTSSNNRKRSKSGKASYSAQKSINQRIDAEFQSIERRRQLCIEEIRRKNKKGVVNLGGCKLGTPGFEKKINYLLGVTTSRPLSELQKSLTGTLDVLTREELYVIRQLEEETRKRGDFKRIFPRANSQSKYGRYFKTPKKFNLLLFKYCKEKKEKRVKLLFQRTL